MPKASCEGGPSMRSDTKRMYSNELGRISEALIASGFISLDHQAKALGLGRSTAWMIIKNKHKLGRLSAKTIKRILENRETPPRVRTIIEGYRLERFADTRAGRKPKRIIRNGVVG